MDKEAKERPRKFFRMDQPWTSHWLVHTPEDGGPARKIPQNRMDQPTTHAWSTWIILWSRWSWVTWSIPPPPMSPCCVSATQRDAW
jgi:hypothetical protein